MGPIEKFNRVCPGMRELTHLRGLLRTFKKGDDGDTFGETRRIRHRRDAADGVVMALRREKVYIGRVWAAWPTYARVSVGRRRK